MPLRYPEHAELTITALDLEAALKWRSTPQSCGECLVSQAVQRTFHASAAGVGYDGFALFRRAQVRDQHLDTWPPLATYAWDDKRVSSLIVAYDARDDRKVAELLPMTIRVWRTS